MRLLAIVLLASAFTTNASAQAPVEATFYYIASYGPPDARAGGFLQEYSDLENHRLLVPSAQREPDELDRLVRIRYRPTATRRVLVTPIPYQGGAIPIEVHGELERVIHVPESVDAFRWVAQYLTRCMNNPGGYIDEYVSLDGTTRLIIDSELGLSVGGQVRYAIVRYQRLPPSVRRFSPWACSGAPEIERQVHGQVLSVEAEVGDEAAARALLAQARSARTHP